ncbi:D-glycero-alpha-D-manno-heptose-1,7-bisphosphate 7-phosphatase [Streptomyces sp. NPDC091268]|uniref:D-glycero-alpha-D-manno-heptose-1,7-bisphosphate 7-phosphatase n=1 Tax=Streptomyces sp. NPDC091268 TaxID=3365979 RepID=UPI00382E05FA
MSRPPLPGSATGRAPAGDGPWLWSRPGAAPAPRPSGGSGVGDLPEAVLFDRDGTLVVDVPYNGDPARVRPMPTAPAAVRMLRELGVRVGVVSNQSGVARGLLSREQVRAVGRRVDELFGPFDVWAVCPHGPADGCACRKPAPGLVLAACARLGTVPARTVVVGDIGSDLGAARAAGARGVLVPTRVTRPEEVRDAGETARDLLAAVRLLTGRGGPRAGRDPDLAAAHVPAGQRPGGAGGVR